MATPRKPGNGKIIDIDGGTGLPMIEDHSSPTGDAPDTAATRKTEDMYWSLLGNDKEGTGYVTVHHLGNGKNGSETLVIKEDADIHQRHELEALVKDQKAPLLHPNAVGMYRIRLFVHDGTGYRKRGEDTFSVVAGEAPKTSAQVAVVPQGIDPTLALLLQQNNQLLQKLAEPKVTEPSPFMAMMKETAPLWLPIAGGVITSLLNRRPDNSLALMKDAFAIAGVAKELQGDATEKEPESPWAGPIKQGLELANNLLTQRALTVAPPAPVAPGQTPATPVGMPQHPLYAQIVNLLPLAAEDQDPEAVAAELWPQLPEQYRPGLVQFMDRREAIRDMIAVHPDVALYPGWFEDMKVALLDIAKGSVQDTGQQAKPGATFDHDSGPDHAQTTA